RGEPGVRLVLGLAGPLDLEVEGARKARGPAPGGALGGLGLAREQGAADFAGARARERDQPVVRALAALVEPGGIDLAPPTPFVLEPGARDQFAEPQVARMVAREQQQPARPVTIVGMGDPAV